MSAARSAEPAAAPHALATVVAVNISPGGIPKTPLPRGDVRTDGLAGDAHNHDKHNTPMQAISLIDLEDLDHLRREGFAVGPGATGENITLRGTDIDARSVGDHLQFSGGVELELTKRRNPCYVLDAIDPALKTAIRGRCGFYARVIVGGEVTPGEQVRITAGERAHERCVGGRRARGGEVDAAASPSAASREGAKPAV